MARPRRPARNKAALSSRQLRRFRHIINSDKVFSTHRTNFARIAAPGIVGPLVPLQLAGIVESRFCRRAREIADTGQSTSSKAEPRRLRTRDSCWLTAVTSALSGSELVGARCRSFDRRVSEE